MNNKYLIIAVVALIILIVAGVAAYITIDNQFKELDKITDDADDGNVNLSLKNGDVNVTVNDNGSGFTGDVNIADKNGDVSFHVNDDNS